MIITKIRDWVPTNGLIHTSTIWELALDADFETIIYTKQDDINLSFFQYDIDVPVDTTYFLRQRKIMNNGESEITSQTIEITGTETIRENTILPRDMFINHPTVYVDEAAIKDQDEFKMSTSEFKANDGYHAYTHWLILDGLGKVLFSSLYDKENLTAISIPNNGQEYETKSKLIFRAIHGTNLGIESKPGNYTLFNNNTNFEIVTNLNNVFPYKDLVIKFKKISAKLRLGIESVEVYYGNTLTTSRKFYLDEDEITVNWWMLKHGSELSMHIKCVDIYDNVITVKKKISVATFENDVIKDESFKYQKMIDTWVNSDNASSKDFFIPNGFYSEPLHNNYIPLVKKNSSELHYYDLKDTNVLEYVGTFKGIKIPTKDELKEGMHIRRLNQDVVFISHVVLSDTGDKIHQIDFYKYNIENDDYILFKELQIADEKYSLGWTNAIAQTSKNKMFYIPFDTDKIKSIDLDSYIVETVCSDIPIILPQTTDEITGEKSKVKTPIMMYLGDGRLLVSGGYSSTAVTYDYINNNFQQSINWEYESYMGNQLTSTFLNNGDSLIIMTEKEERGIDQSQDNLNKKDPVEIKVDKDLETIFEEVNNNSKMKKTVIRLDQSKYIVKPGDDFSIDFVTNFGTMDPDQLLLVYDKDTFRVDEKTTLGLSVRAFSRAATGKHKFTIIASKNQSFDPETSQPRVEFTHTVITNEIEIEIVSEIKQQTETTEIETGTLGKITTNSERETLVLLGNSYNYNADSVELSCYREKEILIPFETVNCVIDDLEYEHSEILPTKGEIKISKLNTNMGLIKILNYTMSTNPNISIYNKLRRSKFIDLEITMVDIPANGLPIKPSIVENNKKLPNMSVLSYTELARYNFTTADDTAKPEFIVNRSELANIITTSKPYNYMFSVKKKGFTYLYLTSEKYTNGIYSNRFYLINDVDLVPDLDIANPNIDMRYSSSVTAKLVNDLSGYLTATKDRSYEIFIEQDQASKELLQVLVKGTSLTLTAGNRTGENKFKVGIRNKIDGMTKISTFNYSIYTEDIFPNGLTCKFLDSTTGLNGETLWFNPGLSYNYTYTKTGNKVALFIPDNEFFNKDDSLTSLENDTEPKLILKGDEDLGNADIIFTFYNANNRVVSSLTKHIKMVPVVFYVNDRFDGEVLANNFNFIVNNGEYTEYKIKPKMGEGYSLTSVKLIPIDNTDVTGLKYSIRLSGDVDSAEYVFKIETPISKDEKVYKFKLQYTYINDNGNLIASMTDSDYQVLSIKSVYYKREAYLHILENNFTMHVGDTRQIKLLTNGDKIKYTLGEQDLLDLDEIAGTITALKPGRASVIIQAGSQEQVPEQDTLYVNIEKEEEEPELNQGFIECAPNPIVLYIGLRMSIAIQTDGDGYSVSSLNRSVAVYDNITKQVIATGVGNTQLKITYWGENIKGGTIYVPVEIKETPDSDPSILYFDSFNRTLKGTNIIFTDRTFPKSILRDKSGKVILARNRLKKENDTSLGYETIYTVFY